MRTETQQKLKAQYIVQERQKMEADVYYQHLLEKCMTALKYSVPVITIQHGFMSQEVPTAYTQIREVLDHYITERYPTLSTKPVGFINYVKNHGTEPWYNAQICPPAKLSLPAIDKRLSLFKEYLRYRLNNWNIIPNILDIFERTGFLYFYPTETVLDFEEWLYLENFDNLVIIDWRN